LKEVIKSKKEEESIIIFIPVSGTNILVYLPALVRWKERHETTWKLASLLKSSPNEVILKGVRDSSLDIPYKINANVIFHTFVPICKKICWLLARHATLPNFQ
jgi:hypothetical protein